MDAEKFYCLNCGMDEFVVRVNERYFDDDRSLMEVHLECADCGHKKSFNEE